MCARYSSPNRPSPIYPCARRQSIHVLVSKQGIFNNDGAAWQTQRKTASHIFTVKNFRDFFLTVFREEAQKLALILQKSAAHQEVVDLHDLFHRYTLDSFMRIAFGVDLHILDTYLQGEKRPVAFAAAFDAAQRITDARIFNPFWKWTELVDGSAKIMREAITVMDDFAYDVVRSRRQDPRASEYSDLLSRFLTVKADDSGRKYSDRELRDIVMNMVMYVDIGVFVIDV